MPVIEELPSYHAWCDECEWDRWDISSEYEAERLLDEHIREKH